MGFGLYFVCLINTISAAKYLAPLICFCVFLRPEPVLESFPPESIGLETLFHAATTGYLLFVVDPCTHIDAIAVSSWGVAFNMVWLFLYSVLKSQSQNIHRYYLLKLAPLTALSVAFMGVFFWILQTGVKCYWRKCRTALGDIVLFFLVFQPVTSVINRLHNRIPDDRREPYIIKMTISVLDAVTSAYSIWSQHQQGYTKDDDLWFLFLISCVSTAVALAEIVLRYIGPLRVSDWVKDLFSAAGSHWVVQKVKGLLSGLCSVLRMLWGWLVEVEAWFHEEDFQVSFEL